MVVPVAEVVGVDRVFRLPGGQRGSGEDVHAEALATQHEVERPPRARRVGDQLRRDERQARLEILVHPLRRKCPESLRDEREELRHLPIIDIGEPLEKRSRLGTSSGRGTERGAQD